jgi:hypothetical protein
MDEFMLTWGSTKNRGLRRTQPGFGVRWKKEKPPEKSTF